MSDILAIVGPAIFVIGILFFVIAQAICLTRSVKKHMQRGPDVTYIEKQMNVTTNEAQGFIEANRRRWRR